MIEVETDLDYTMGESEKSNFRTEEKESEKSNFRHSKKRDYECLKSFFVLIIITIVCIYVFVTHLYEIDELNVIDNIVRVVVNESNI